MGVPFTCVSDNNVTSRAAEFINSEQMKTDPHGRDKSAVTKQAQYCRNQARTNVTTKLAENSTYSTTTAHAMKTGFEAQSPKMKGVSIGVHKFPRLFNRQETGKIAKVDCLRQSISSIQKVSLKFLDEAPHIKNTNVQNVLNKLGSFSYSDHKQLSKEFLQFPTFNPVAFEDGIVYIGQWKLLSPKSVVSSELTSSYIIEGIEAIRHGKGKQIWPEGSIYEGFWRDDQADGFGRLIHADGDYYEGEWKNDKAHGKGKYVHPDGSYYEGDWVKDLQEGFGIEHHPNGSVYTGEFVAGEKHGEGKFVNPDGSSYVGSFKNNHFDGKGRYEWADGKAYDGEWTESKFNGYGVFTWKDGRKHEGYYKGGLKHGFGVYHLGNGKKFEGTWKEGMQEGKGTFTSRKGKVLTGTWCQGKRVKGEGDLNDSQILSSKKERTSERCRFDRLDY